MTQKYETKNSLVWGKRGSFYFGQILMTLKKSFVLPCKFLKKYHSQAALEYFILFAAILALTLLSVSAFFPKVKNITEEFYNKTAKAIIGEPLPSKVAAKFEIYGGGDPCGMTLIGGEGIGLNLPDEGYCYALPGPEQHLDIKCWKDYVTQGSAVWSQKCWNFVWGTHLPYTDPPPAGSDPCPIGVLVWINNLYMGRFNLTLNKSNPCFLPGTFVSLADGSVKKIEDIKVGDKVLSFDEKAHKKVASKVVKTFVHKSEEYLIINKKIKATPNHPFYSDGKWQEIGKLTVGSKLLNFNLEEEKIITLKKIKTKQINVYNLEVDKYHSYFAEGCLVHNKGFCSTYYNGCCPDNCQNGPNPPGECVDGGGGP